MQNLLNIIPIVNIKSLFSQNQILVLISVLKIFTITSHKGIRTKKYERILMSLCSCQLIIDRLLQLLKKERWPQISQIVSIIFARLSTARNSRVLLKYNTIPRLSILLRSNNSSFVKTKALQTIKNLCEHPNSRFNPRIVQQIIEKTTIRRLITVSIRNQDLKIKKIISDILLLYTFSNPSINQLDEYYMNFLRLSLYDQDLEILTNTLKNLNYLTMTKMKLAHYLYYIGLSEELENFDNIDDVVIQTQIRTIQGNMNFFLEIL